MQTSDLKPNYYIFGNKGALWGKEAHIAKSGSFSGRTLCGVPMLSSNHCMDEKEIGCKECLRLYQGENPTIKKAQ